MKPFWDKNDNLLGDFEKVQILHEEFQRQKQNGTLLKLTCIFCKQELWIHHEKKELVNWAYVGRANAEYIDSLFGQELLEV